MKVLSRFLPALRRSIGENIEFVSPVELSERGLKRMVQENIVATFGLKYMDIFVLPRFTKNFVDKNIEVVGLEKYRQAQNEGRGVLLVTWHVGTFPILCYLALPSLGGSVLAPVRRIFDYRTQEGCLAACRSHGAEAVQPGGAVKGIVNTLKSGGTVVLAGDHLTSPTGIRVKYFGRETLIPSGPASFACRYRPVTLGCFCVKTGENRYRIEFSDPFAIPSVEKKVEEAHLVEMANAYVRHFEEIVKRYPAQWECFSPIWPEGFDEASIKAFARPFGVMDN
jgi:KDO2-lipid IV(A) lauroyltransferase